MLTNENETKQNKNRKKKEMNEFRHADYLIQNAHQR